MKVYVIGSLRNPRVPEIARAIRAAGFDAFDDWYSAGPEADDRWKEHQQSKGLTYREALNGPAASNVFFFDKSHLDESDAVVLVTPAGKSAHLELGYALGCGKPGFIYMEQEPAKDRWDVMLRFADVIAFGEDELVEQLHRYFALMSPEGTA